MFLGKKRASNYRASQQAAGVRDTGYGIRDTGSAVMRALVTLLLVFVSTLAAGMGGIYTLLDT